MMTCQQVTELLLDLLADDLTAVGCLECQAHLEECVACQAYVHNYRITITLTRQLPQVTFSAQFAAKLQHLLNTAHNEAEKQ